MAWVASISPQSAFELPRLNRHWVTRAHSNEGAGSQGIPVAGRRPLLDVWRIGFDGLGCARNGEVRRSLAVTHEASDMEDRVKGREDRVESGEAANHVLFPIAVAAVFLAVLVVGALVG